MLRGHGFDGLARQIVAHLACGDALQIAGGPRVNAQCRLELFTLKLLRVRSQQVLKNTALEWQKHGAKQMRVQRCERLERRRHALRGTTTGTRSTGWPPHVAAITAAWLARALLTRGGIVLGFHLVRGIAHGGGRRLSICGSRRLRGGWHGR